MRGRWASRPVKEGIGRRAGTFRWVRNRGWSSSTTISGSQ